MSQTTSAFPRKRQRSPTPSRINPTRDIDQLHPDVIELITHLYANIDDSDEWDSDSNDSYYDDETEDNDDDEQVRDDVGNRRETSGEGMSEGTVRRTSLLLPRTSVFNGFKDPTHEVLLLKALDAGHAVRYPTRTNRSYLIESCSVSEGP